MSNIAPASMDSGVWYQLTDPVQGVPWRIQRCPDDVLVIESAALIASATEEQMLAALWAGLIGPWVSSARWVCREGSLHWQACWPRNTAPHLPEAWPLMLEQAQSALGVIDGLLRNEWPASLTGWPLSPTQEEQIALMRGVMNLLESDTQLAPLSDWDEDSASIKIEPVDDDEDWLVLLRAAPVPGEVCIEIPQTLLPQSSKARIAGLQQLLSHNDAQILGPGFQFIMDIQGRQASLQSRFSLAHQDLASLRVELARALAVDDDLTSAMAQPTDPTLSASSLIPAGLLVIRG